MPLGIYKRSIEGEKKRLDAVRESMKDPFWKIKLSKGVKKAYKQDSTYAKRISETRKRKYLEQGFLNSPETRRKISFSLKGKIPWNKDLIGRKNSKETRKKISKALMGHRGWNKGISAWNKGIKGAMPSGENHHNWKGGVTSVNKAIRESFEYEEWRKSVFERDLYTCQFCGEVGGKLNADHIKRFSDYPELRLEVSNGRTLCEPCHHLTDTYGGRKKNMNTEFILVAEERA